MELLQLKFARKIVIVGALIYNLYHHVYKYYWLNFHLFSYLQWLVVFFKEPTPHLEIK